LKLQDHVLRAIESFDREEKDDALMHACFAIDGTACNLFSKEKATNKDYKSCLRQYWWIIERFIGEGLNLEDTKFTYLKLDNGYGKLIDKPDLADIVYHIFRCSHAHAREVPVNFELLPYQDAHYVWKLDLVNNELKMPETIIWALLAVAVFCKGNNKINTQGEHELRWGNQSMGITAFPLKNWWGREDDLKSFFADKPEKRVKLNL
jgi:hypothetical protein